MKNVWKYKTIIVTLPMKRFPFHYRQPCRLPAQRPATNVFLHKKARTDFGLFTPVPADDKRANPKGNWRLICARAILSRNPEACHRILSSGLYVWLNNGTTESQMRRTGDLPAQESKKGPTRVRPFLSSPGVKGCENAPVAARALHRRESKFSNIFMRWSEL